jgi:hypothetical protein
MTSYEYSFPPTLSLLKDTISPYNKLSATWPPTNLFSQDNIRAENVRLQRDHTPVSEEFQHQERRAHDSGFGPSTVPMVSGRHHEAEHFLALDQRIPDLIVITGMCLDTVVAY